MADPSELRAAMVAEQLAGRGISDRRVLAAMGEVPRERFVLPGDRARAYDDAALGIEHGQTISQPWIVAAITAALELEPTDRVLEIGTGSGYSTAVFARLAAEVVSVERIAELTAAARVRLEALGVEGVELLTRDGSLGVPERAPFDGIAVHAAAPAAPATLLGQLAPGGRLVAPVSRGRTEYLTRFRRGEQGAISETNLGACRFVPLLGEEGFPAP